MATLIELQQVILEYSHNLLLGTTGIQNENKIFFILMYTFIVIMYPNHNWVSLTSVINMVFLIQLSKLFCLLYVGWTDV